MATPRGSIRGATNPGAGLDTIDASESTPACSAIPISPNQLVEDIFALLRNGLPPDERRLDPREKQGLRYWRCQVKARGCGSVVLNSLRVRGRSNVFRQAKKTASNRGVCRRRCVLI